MPLDHFNPADTRTLPVTFAVLPATGRRQGMFVTATGGPGTSGIAVADSYTAAYDPDRDRFVLDVVTTGRWECALRYVRTGERTRVAGRCDGKPVVWKAP